MLDQPGVTVALWGARHPDELDPVGDTVGWKLDAEAISYVDAVLTETIPEPVGPEFMAPPEESPHVLSAAQPG